MSGLATTISTIVKSKAAAAALGVVLVGGSGTAAAVAATHNGDIGPVHTPLFAHGTDQNASDSDKNGDHAHTISIEGVLDSVKSCPSSVTTIVVTKASESAEHDVKDTNTNNDSHGDAASATHAATTPGAEATEVEKAETPSAKPAGTETLTVTVNSKTKVNGEKDADGLGSLCGKTGHKVQVQAEKNANGALVAWKVTLQGADSDTGKGNNATPGANGNGGDHSSVSGAIASVGKSSFTVKGADGKTVTVTVNAQTVFSGRASGLSALHAGEKVTVEGTKQADGSILATHVADAGN